MHLFKTLFITGSPQTEPDTFDGTAMTIAQILADKGAHLFTCGYENSSR